MQTMGPLIQEACVLTGENKERVMALAYRESQCSFALTPPGDPVGWGDNNNAFGPFQIDKRYHADFIKRELGRYCWSIKQGIPYRPIEQALYACGLLREARDWFRRSSSAVSGDTLERAVYASYNAGPARVLSALQTSTLPTEALRIDSATTGKDYSGYIWALSSVLQGPRFSWVWEPA
jgi:hypothetical protein